MTIYQYAKENIKHILWGLHRIKKIKKVYWWNHEEFEGGTRKDRFLVSMANSILLKSVTIKSDKFTGKKCRASDFLKKQRNKESKFLLDTLQSKTQQKNKKHSQVFMKVDDPQRICFLKDLYKDVSGMMITYPFSSKFC